MSRNLSLTAWIAVSAAAMAWVGVVLFVGMISTLESRRSSLESSTQDQMSQANQDAFIHSFMANSTTERAELDSLSRIDPSSFAQMITGVGAGSGAAISITSATQGASVQVDTASAVDSYVFLVSAQGTFSSVMRAGKLLETIPAPSTIEQIEFTHAPTAAGGSAKPDQWEVNAQIQVLSETSK